MKPTGSKQMKKIKSPSARASVKKCLALMAAALCATAFSANIAWPETLHVHPPGSKQAGKGHYSGFSKIKWGSVSPGDVVLLYDDGVFTEHMLINAKGAPGRPVTIRPAPGKKPVINSSFVLSGAEHVVIEGVTISDSAYSGVIIKDGSNNITVSHSIIKDSPIGIWIGDGAGMENKLLNNEIFSNKMHGIAVDRVNCAAGKETLIAGNRVFSNGYHGLEINGSYYIIEGNEVYRNGHGIVGASGIHLYAKNARQDAGDHNIIRYNISHHNKEGGKGQDGGGITLDQWCDFNEVYYNIAHNNDGSGIILFDSSDNLVYNNTLFNNIQDSEKSHVLKGELVLASDIDHDVDHVSNVKVFNNIIVTTRPSYFAIYVDRLTVDNKNEIWNNLFFHTKGADFYFWASETGKDITRWKALRGGAGDEFYQDPKFAAPQPSRPDEFLTGRALKGDSLGNHVKDFLGKTFPKGAQPELGAVRTKP